MQGQRAHHPPPDVRRMLMTMRAHTEGCRAMASVAAAAYDAAHHHPDAEVRKQNQAFYEFMVPLVKGYSTEMSLEVASLGVQVHGGMGFIEETGAAQYYRDAKILTIYEGTTAIQANDLVGRKTARDGGQTAKAIARRSRPPSELLRQRQRRRGRPWPSGCAPRAKAFLDVVDFVAGNSQGQPQRGVRRQRALPDAGRQPGGRLAAGRALLVAQDRSSPRARTWSLHEGQDRHGPLLRRPHPQSRAGPARQHRRRARTA
jgi:hypothetical protein